MDKILEYITIPLVGAIGTLIAMAYAGLRGEITKNIKTEFEKRLLELQVEKNNSQKQITDLSHKVATLSTEASAARKEVERIDIEKNRQIAGLHNELNRVSVKLDETIETLRQEQTTNHGLRNDLDKLTKAKEAAEQYAQGVLAVVAAMNFTIEKKEDVILLIQKESETPAPFNPSEVKTEPEDKP